MAENNKESIKMKQLFDILYCSIFIVLVLLGYSPFTGNVLFIVSMAVMISLIYIAVKNKDVCCIVAFVYMLSYIWVMRYEFLDYGVKISVYEAFNKPQYFYKSSIVHYLGLVVFFIFYTPSPEHMEKPVYIYNPWLFCLGVLGALLAFVFGKTGDVNVLSNGNYGHSGASHSSLYEYFMLFYVMAYFFHGNKKRMRWILYILGGMYVIKNTLFGGRIETVMLCMGLLAMEFQYRLKFSTIIVCLIIGYVLMSALGEIRGGGSFEMADFFQQKHTISTQEADVNYSSARMIGIVTDGYMSNSLRITAFLYFLAAFFLPWSLLPQWTNLSWYRGNQFGCGGGGLFTAYIYVYLWYIGIILVSRLIIGAIQKQGRSTYSLAAFINVLTLVTLPRWYAYNVIAFFKLGVLGGCVIYLMYQYLKKQNREEYEY